MNPIVIKGPWCSEEDWILFLSRRVLQNRWSDITKVLFSRTDNDCKNRWNTVLKHKLSEMNG